MNPFDGVTLMVYEAVVPALIVVPEGVAESAKSARKIVSATVEVCCPAVPVTVTFIGLALEAVSPFTVMLLDCPAVIPLGLKEQVTPLPPQVKVMLWPNDEGADAAMLNDVDVVPIRTTLDRLFADREN